MNRVISMLGFDKDNRGVDEKRWSKWRPNISLCAQKEFVVDELYLLYSENGSRLFHNMVKDIKTVSPDTNVIGVKVDFGGDPWDFAEAYITLFNFAETLDRDNDYYVHITTGTHTAQFAFASLVLNNTIQGGKLLQTRSLRVSDQADPIERAKGDLSVVDFSLSKYDAIAERFNVAKAASEDVLKRGIKTLSPSYNTLISQIEKVAIRSNSPMLITGETGAGKTQLVKQLFQVKKDKNMVSGDFVFVNCATLNGNTEGAKSALFGHKKGAYTGATSERKGFLSIANDGILFLDEVATLGLEEQGMLLHALEEKEFYPLGSEKVERADFVLICGTNTDLREAVRQGAFRADLLARIKMWTFKLPGLRERREDIEPNIQFELAVQSTKEGCRVSFTKEAETMYINFAKSSAAKWLDNFRDLNSSVERMTTMSDKNRIGVDTVTLEIERLKEDWSDGVEMLGVALSDYVDFEVLDNMSMIDATLLRHVIEVCLSSTSAAAAGRSLYANNKGELSIANPTSRLANYLKKYELKFEQLG